MRSRILCFLIAGMVALSQDRSATIRPPVTFEVVSVKPVSPNNDHLLTSYCFGGGGFVHHGTPLLDAIAWAYGVNKNQIDGGPGWLNSSGTYDIDAIAQGPVTQADCKKMVQALFEDRFKLRMQKQSRAVPVFQLVLAKNGPKFTAGDTVTFNGRTRQVTTERGDPVGWTMARLANYLASFPTVQRPVVDRTMLGGTYGFTLNYAVADGDDRPDIFAALPEQLGLRLEATRAAVEMWVIEQVERPSAN